MAALGEVKEVQPVNMPPLAAAVDVVSMALIVARPEHPLNISSKVVPDSVASEPNEVKLEQSLKVSL